MIRDIVANNPDDRILRQAAEALENGSVICLPTDTNWVFAADPYNKAGVERLYEIKGATRDKQFSMICSDIRQGSRYAVISSPIYRQIHRILPGPYTFIFRPTRDLPKLIRPKRSTAQIGIRVPNTILCQRLIITLDKPLLSTSLSIDAFDFITGQERELFSYQIEERYRDKLALILDEGGSFREESESTVIDFCDEDLPVVKRQGVGDITSLGL